MFIMKRVKVAISSSQNVHFVILHSSLVLMFTYCRYKSVYNKYYKEP